MSDEEPRPVPLARFLRADDPPAPAPEPPPPDPAEYYERGFRDGMAAASAEAAEAERASADLHRLTLAAADESARALLDAVAEAMTEAALAIARAVLAAEPTTRPDLVHRLVADVLAAAPADAAGRLYLHPEALPLLAGSEPAGWMLVGDPSLERHAVRAELGSHQLLASLVGRLERAASALGGGG